MRDETLWTRLQAIDLLSVDDLKLPSGGPFGGKPLSKAVKLEIIAELRRFLYLLAVSRESLVPSHFVALALQSLRALPAVDLPQPIALNCLSIATTKVPIAISAGYLRTLELRASEFGAADPERIWPARRSLKLQLLGWSLLAIGIVFGIAARFGFSTMGASVIFLLTGGFLWLTEGPWLLSLPFRKAFVAKLNP